jgi:hypothetical protein
MLSAKSIKVKTPEGKYEVLYRQDRVKVEDRWWTIVYFNDDTVVAISSNDAQAIFYSVEGEYKILDLNPETIDSLSKMIIMRFL